MPKAKKTDPKRVGSLLLQSLQESGISEKHAEINSPPIVRADTFAYWQTINDNNIEVVFLAEHWAGKLRCSVSLISLATHAAQLFRDDAKAVSALVDALKYLKTTMFLLLPITTQDMLVRAINLHPLLKSSKRSIEASRALREVIEDPMISAFRKRITRTEKQLRAEKISSGGSETRLSKKERQMLHIQYDELHTVAKTVKQGDYKATLKRFAKQRLAKGYTPKHWRDHWASHVAHNYPPELKDFLALLAHRNNPTASEVAYTVLAKRTPHKRSYLPKLVSDSRKAAKTSTMGKSD